MNIMPHAHVVRCINPCQEIDLINVAFEQKDKVGVAQFQVPDRLTALSTLKELSSHRKWNLVLVSFVNRQDVYMHL